MLVEKSLAGGSRLYALFGEGGKVRISLKPKDGLWKIHIPKDVSRIEDNRVVLEVTDGELREVAEGIGEILSGENVEE